MPLLKKKRKHFFNYDVNRLIRLLEKRDEVVFEHTGEGDEDPDRMSDEELFNVPVEKRLAELQAKSTVLLFESSRQLEKLTWFLICLTVVLTILTTILIIRTIF